MPDPRDNQPEPTHNLPEYSVSEISSALKRTVEDTYGHVRVRGEVSGFKRAASGHLYMTLKDENAVIDGVCWKGVAGRLGIAPEDGLEVIVTGRLTTYPGRSKYQIVIEAMEHAGEGALLKLLEERRRKLAAEGLFDEDRKREIPYLPDVIGVVTSPTGAVIRDILHRLADRFPRHVLVWPVLVQGEGAAGQVAAAIEGFNRMAPDGAVPRPDLLIVARGGGSLEDLWAFNEEIVVRAAAASGIPLISAVGHETDTTLIDFASDRRAPTPTAAAEMAVPVRADVLARVMENAARMTAAANRTVEERRARVEGLARGLPDPRSVLETAAQRTDDWSERLGNSIAALLDGRAREVARLGDGLRPATLARDISRQGERVQDLAGRIPAAFTRHHRTLIERLANAGSLLESYSYARVLDRGFALVRDGAGSPVTRAAQTQPGMQVAIQFADAEVAAAIGQAGEGRTTTTPAPGRKPAPKKSAPKKAPDEKQGTLL